MAENYRDWMGLSENIIIVPHEGGKMPKAKLTATTTVEMTTEIRLSPQARQMLLDRLIEHQKCAATVAELSGKKTKKHPQGGRMRRLADEIQDLFRHEKIGKALLDGTAIEGHRVKLVVGERSVFDQMGFMKKHGLTQADFDAFTETAANEPYLKISHSGDDE